MISGGQMKKNNFFSISASILAFSFLICIPALSSSEQKNDEKTEASHLFNFADKLLQEGDYYRAITEYKRFISYYPQAPEIPDAVIGIANAYYKAEKYDDAIESYKDFLAKYPENKNIEEAVLNLADSFIKTKRTDSAIILFDEIEEKMPDSSLAEKLKILLGKYMLKEGRFDDAEMELGKVKEKSREKREAEVLLGSLKQMKELELKSPLLAGLMSSVLPGAGQVYAGRKKDAVFSFLLNGLFTWGAVESFNRNIYAAGAILSFFEFGWYTGNIYNAVSDTHKYNRKIQNDFLNDNLSMKMRGIIPFQNKDNYKVIAFKIHF